MKSVSEELQFSQLCLKQRDETIRKLQQPSYQASLLGTENGFLNNHIRAFTEMSSEFEFRLLAMDKKLLAQNDRIKKALSTFAMIKNQRDCTKLQLGRDEIAFEDRFKLFSHEVLTVTDEMKSVLVQLGEKMHCLCDNQSLQLEDKSKDLKVEPMSGDLALETSTNSDVKPGVPDLPFSNVSEEKLTDHLSPSFAHKDKTVLAEAAGVIYPERDVIQICALPNLSSPTNTASLIDLRAGHQCNYY